MTRDELDAATDEQLNEMAAKNIMGWTIRNHRMPDDEYVSIWYSDDGLHAPACEDWSPATSWDDAGKLVEKMRENGLHAKVDDEVDVYYAAFSTRDGRGIACTARHPSAPRAITTAALLAWEAKEKA